MNKNERWQGITISVGTAVARAVVLLNAWMPLATMPSVEFVPEKELAKLRVAVQQTKADLKQVRQQALDRIGVAEAHIFDAHLAMLEDPTWWQEWQECIEHRRMTVTEALQYVGDRSIALLLDSVDQRIRERCADVRDVIQRVMHHASGREVVAEVIAEEPFVLLAQEITPSQFVQLDHRLLRGIVTGTGGYTSHTAIMARALHIPFVMVYEEALFQTVQSGDWIIVQANQGEVVVRPSVVTMQQMMEQYQQEQIQLQQLRALSRLPAYTEDGQTIALYANITATSELAHVWENGAMGIGLFRSECVFMEHYAYPSEEEQFEVYHRVAISCRGRPLTIRLIDIGGDKRLPYVAHPQEENPAMGYRSIRMSLAEPTLLVTQLRAVLRASVYGDVRILLPMISHMEQLLELKNLIERTRMQLSGEGFATRVDVPIGIMIEVPAVAILAEQFAKEVQFFSIGTNDLTQFILATDRMNERVAHLYNPYHPAVIALIRHVAHVANTQGTSLSVCGEMAADPIALPIWLGCGITTLSMSSPRIVQIKQALRSCSVQRSMALMPALAKARTAEEIKTLLENVFQ